MVLRQDSLHLLKNRTFDSLIIGGGINGAVGAASLAGHGTTVALLEQNDFASATSQESSNLIWGGIKYLETKEFKLVRELCLSRNFLLNELPEHVKETRFVNPHEKGFRHRLGILYTGALLYWILGRYKTKRPKQLSLKKVTELIPGLKKERFDGALEYSDAVLLEHDTRFVFHFIKQAQHRGACCVNYLEVLSSTRHDDRWCCEVKDKLTGDIFKVYARTLVNASGPWVDKLNQTNAVTSDHKILLSKGVHLITRSVGPKDKVVAFFANDGRLFFVIPFGGRSLIGTTDTRSTEPHTSVSEEEITFILDNVNLRLALEVPLSKADIISTRCGVRPLASSPKSATAPTDWMSLSRRHVLEVKKELSYLTIFGGKLTDCIPMGNELTRAVRHLGVFMPSNEAVWWKSPELDKKKEFVSRLRKCVSGWTGSKKSLVKNSNKWWMRFENKSLTLLSRIEEDHSLAEEIFAGAEVCWAEIGLMAEEESIVRLEDFLRRRTRLSLLFRYEGLKAEPSLKKVCEILFASEAEAKWNEYFSK